MMTYFLRSSTIFHDGGGGDRFEEVAYAGGDVGWAGVVVTCGPVRGHGDPAVERAMGPITKGVEAPGVDSKDFKDWNGTGRSQAYR